MLAGLASRFAGLLPASWLRRIGAWQWTGALQRRFVQGASRWLRESDVTIRHGAAAGLRFNAGGANPGYALGTTEPAVQDALEGLLHAGDIFYDIGANVGFFTVLAARLVGPGGRVVAFEPLPANVAALRRNLALNGFANAVVVEAAAGVAGGTADLVPEEEPTWARLAGMERGSDAPPDPSAGAVRVRVVSVDETVEAGAAPPPTLVKIDVEGAELDVVSGMARTLRTHRPTLLVEMHGKNREFAALLARHGYAGRCIECTDPVEIARWDVHVIATPPGAAATS